MKFHYIVKKTVNAFLIISIIIFIGSTVLHGYISSVNAIGSSGGRITVVITSLCPPAGSTPPCNCGTFHTTIMPAPGSMDTIFCFPAANFPLTGIPITIASPGYLILGNFIAAFPIAMSINWGTSYTPG